MLILLVMEAEVANVQQLDYTGTSRQKCAHIKTGTWGRVTVSLEVKGCVCVGWSTENTVVSVAYFYVFVYGLVCWCCKVCDLIMWYFYLHWDQVVNFDSLINFMMTFSEWHKISNITFCLFCLFVWQRHIICLIQTFLSSCSAKTMHVCVLQRGSGRQCVGTLVLLLLWFL